MQNQNNKGQGKVHRVLFLSEHRGHKLQSSQRSKINPGSTGGPGSISVDLSDPGSIRGPGCIRGPGSIRVNTVYVFLP